MNSGNSNNDSKELAKVVRTLINLVVILTCLCFLLLLTFLNYDNLSNYLNALSERRKAEINIDKSSPVLVTEAPVDSFWKAPELISVTDNSLKEKIEYGKELIVHTSKYLGPKGSIQKISNGMNCQNCHLDAGTKPWGNNYGSVASLYPKFRSRSGSMENIYKRVNDCIERSLNGRSLDTLGKEMQSLRAYIEFLGTNVTKGKKAEGSGLKDLAFMERAANPDMGHVAYISKCQSCHQQNGEGTFNQDSTEYIYPPLWGTHSYNDGAGLFRISNFAKYIKYNMPLGVNHLNSQLTDEEAWDIAAFVNSRNRPHKNVPKDWPDISKKPIDHPFGPYADGFSEKQHKFGPFKPIAEEQKKREEQKKKEITANK